MLGAGGFGDIRIVGYVGRALKLDRGWMCAREGVMEPELLVLLHGYMDRGYVRGPSQLLEWRRMCSRGRTGGLWLARFGLGGRRVRYLCRCEFEVFKDSRSWHVAPSLGEDQRPPEVHSLLLHNCCQASTRRPLQLESR